MPDLAQGPARLKAFDDEIIEMSKTLDAAPPFLVKDEDVSSEDH